MAGELTEPTARVKVTLRPAGRDDLAQWLALFEAVASEGRWIGYEPPIDHEAATRRFAGYFDQAEPAVMLLAEIDGALVGCVNIHVERGLAGLGMMVAAGSRRQGVGSSLLDAALDWAREAGAHKVALAVWPHNVAARRLYTRYGFVDEGRRRRHYRRRSGELWDAIDMGLILDATSPGSPFGEDGA